MFGIDILVYKLRLSCENFECMMDKNRSMAPAYKHGMNTKNDGFTYKNVSSKIMKIVHSVNLFVRFQFNLHLTIVPCNIFYSRLLVCSSIDSYFTIILNWVIWMLKHCFSNNNDGGIRNIILKFIWINRRF